MYKTTKEITKKMSLGIISSLLYTFCLYRIVDVYTRAAIGEVLAFAFLPLIIWGLYELIYNDQKKWWILPIGIFGIINSHIIYSVIAIGIIMYFLLINVKKIFKEKSRIKYIIIAGIVSILLTVSVILPIGEQVLNNKYKVFSNGTSEELSTKSLILSQVFMDEYRYDICKNNSEITGQMNFGNGILLLILPLFIFITKWQDKKEKRFIWQLFILGILTLIATTVLFPWQYFKIFNFIQLPWRLNIVISCCFAIVGTYTFYYSISKQNKDFLFILAIIIVIVTSNYLNKIKYTDEIEQENSIQNIGQEEYVPAIGYNIKDNYVFDNNNKEITYDYIRQHGSVKFELTQTKNSEQINIPFIYYEGYKAYIENEDTKQELKLSINNNGLILLNNKDLKVGKVEVKYEMTACQIIAYLITYLTLLITCYYIIYYYFEKKEGK